MEMTLEQRRAVALARARAAAAGENIPSAQPMTGEQIARAENLPVPGMMTPDPPKPQILRSPIPGGDFLNQVGTDLATNIPVVGPLVERASNAMGSAAVSAATGRPYDEVLNERERINQMRRDEQPVASAIGTVAGTVGPLMRVAQTPMGGQALGTSGPTLQRAGMGLVTGGALAAGDTAARGEGRDAIVNALLVGGGLGAAFPLLERGGGAILRALTASDADRAAYNIASGLERDKVNPRDIPAVMQQGGPDAMLIDAGPNLTRKGAAIASLPGEGQTIVRDALVKRNLGTNARIQGDVNSTFGPAPIPSRVAAEIDANRKALSPFYEQALEGAKAVDTEGVALTLDSMIVNERGAAQNAAEQVRRMLNVKGTDVLDPNPRTLLNTRHAIDGILYTDGAMAPLDTNVKRVLQTARREIDAELAAKVPGIKDVDARYSELAQQGKAVGTGEQALESGRNTVIRPAEMNDLMQEGVETIVGPSGVPFRISQGTRAEIDRLIGTTGNDVNALKTALKGDGSWNREKLAQLFGEDKAGKLISLLDREQAYQRTYNTVLANSETAARQQAQKDVAPRQFGERPTGIVDMLMRIPQAVANTAAKSRSEAVNQQIAEALMSRPTPELVDRLIAARAANRGTIGVAPVPLLTNR